MMRTALRYSWSMFALCWCLLSTSVWAVDPLIYNDDVEAYRHKELSAELRCLVCQNQSLADSDAPLAQDLRHEVLDLMRQGLGDQEIKDYLVNRYSDFVLYRPRVTGATYVLWFGPAVLVGFALWVLFSSIRKQQSLANQREALDEGPHEEV